MKISKRNIIYTSIALIGLVVLAINVVSRLADDAPADFPVIRTFPGELKDRNAVAYQTKKYPFMDEITDLVKQSISDLKLNMTSSRDLSREYYYYTVQYSNENLPSAVDFTSEGSYYIGIDTNRPFLLLDPIFYRFKYNGINFFGDQKLNDFFINSIDCNPLSVEEVGEKLCPDVDFPYDYISWFFAVDRGKIVLALCKNAITPGCYDIINKQKLTIQEYNRRYMNAPLP